PKYDFPSAASIPAVSIMNAEPPPPKEPKEQTGTATAHPAGEKPAASVAPVPPKRPQKQAATPPPAAARSYLPDRPWARMFKSGLIFQRGEDPRRGGLAP